MLSTHWKGACMALFLGLSGAIQADTATEPVDQVYPYLDSANSRWFYFSSASMPFGMVNLSPDTETGGAWGSGYRYNSKEIKGFSHVHAWQLAALSVMPVSSSQPLEKLRKDYYSPFDHKNETVSPGYHQVLLDRYGIKAELTATTRVGLHRYTFSKGQPQQVLFNLGGTLGPSEFGVAEIRQTGPSALSGFVTNEPTFRRPRPARVYFHAEFDRPVERIDAWRGEEILAGVGGITGLDSGVLVQVADSDKPLLMKVGISYVSAANARLNLDTEVGGTDFDTVAENARNEWNQWLGKIEVSGGTDDQQRRFYTDLWHALQGRRIISDVNGEYTDNTGMEPEVRQLPVDRKGNPRFNHHNSDSFWGAQWTIATLWPLVYPQVASDFTNSLLTYYRDGGVIPRGPSGGNYTYVMTGASSTPFIVSNYMKGIRDFDKKLAWQGLQKNHGGEGLMSRAGYEHFTQTGGGVKHYIEQGYIPYPLPETDNVYASHRRGAGQTLEYAYQDFALAQFAKELGHKKEYSYYMERSQNYRNVYDSESGFMRPRNPDGSWQKPFDPYQYENGFVESNAAQGTWFVPHDIAGLAELMGGSEKLVERLDADFQTAAKQGFTAGKSHSEETVEKLRRSPINYGNQPSMQTAFIFSAAGAPWKTQYWSRRVIDEVYSDLSPERGYNGDEDQGLMGSLAVLLKIGLFQLTGGVEEDPVYLIGSPIFDEITIALSDKYYSGKTFRIKTVNNSPDSPYVSKIRLNGKQLDRTWLLHSEIIDGGELVLSMSDSPNTALK